MGWRLTEESKTEDLQRNTGKLLGVMDMFLLLWKWFHGCTQRSILIKLYNLSAYNLLCDTYNSMKLVYFTLHY